ncbi:Uncharacterized membrane protein YcaP, DUF421 family [Lentzea xinjiangensis]|uniref:Uncharacterized membrane protein YcaP, DUF421 family n=1 Tax=Lentzea xinjiangensis TaxID=402600 RepID=A0A1H9JIF2_9PSEU|nr:YetF domain-containing protein [Lentzea xinjiangensis]SEQ86616.1 Uncharacterized membrane protein YcaP, DUF421 family [Lentzea xinjiangensis]
MLFDSWTGLLRVVIVGICAYTALVLLLRLSGKRTLAKMNAFDLVVTVALGSTLATVLLTSDVALAEGVLALALLVGAQFAVAWTSVRLPLVRRTVKSSPTLLVWRGSLRDDVLRDQRVNRAEVLQAVRAQGLGGLDQVAAVVLETDGTFSVVPISSAGSLDTLDNVPDVPCDRFTGRRQADREPC